MLGAYLIRTALLVPSSHYSLHGPCKGKFLKLVKKKTCLKALKILIKLVLYGISQQFEMLDIALNLISVQLIGHFLKETLIHPTFIINHLEVMSPLAK